MKTISQEECYKDRRFLCLLSLIRIFCLASSMPVEHDANLNFTVSISENSRRDAEVFNFQETLGSNVHSFQILSGNKDNRFNITYDGILVTRGFLDYDIDAYYKLHISFTERLLEYEAILTVTVQDENDWPPFYNLTCETPVYKDRYFYRHNDLLFDIIIGNHTMAASDYKFPAIILEADTDNGRCGIDFFLDLFDPFTFLCGLPCTFIQLGGPKIPKPKMKFYNGRNTFPGHFSQNSAVRSDCIGELLVEGYPTSAPISMLVSAATLNEVLIKTVTTRTVNRGCPEGKYGFFCDKDCMCQNGATCHGFNGACKCSKGWTGPACDIALKEIWITSIGTETIYDKMFYLSCHYTFKANDTIWTFFDGSSSRILHVGRQQISYELHSSQLTISDFDGKRAGTYQCSVTDQNGEEYTAETTVTYADCAEDLFGDFCNNTCNCTHAVRCDRSFGCICLDGWTGKICDLDVQAPNLTGCPTDKTVLADVDDNSAIVQWINPSSSDNSGQPIVLESNRESGGRFAIGKHDVIMWASDQSNNTAFCNFSVIVARMEETAGTIFLPVYLWVILASAVFILIILIAYVAKQKRPYVPVDGNDQDFDDYLKVHLPMAVLAWNVKRKALKISKEEPIGVGEYGRVYKARLTIDGREQVVAAKTLCETRSDAISRKNFVNEVRCLVELENHPNIISFLGIETSGDSKYILTEYASEGDLKSYLKSLTFLSTETETRLIKVARDIANALSFMSMKGVMHKDIAARNVLLTNDLTAKIGDFGLGRDVNERLGSDYHSLLWANQHCRFPLRWMPLEFLVDGSFTLEGDRWSYGILLWEIGSLGGSPLMDVRVEDLIEYLQKGCRPMKPEGCTPTAYQIMQRCWREERYERPTPDQLLADFDCMLRMPANSSQRFFTAEFKGRNNKTTDNQ
ncbi:uncharacterized protein [Ptychodera flava]|uniref:uncharacterized protein n=1 Tax=Ptychodera flava TaxID=63121 RepID=UPI00396A827D